MTQDGALLGPGGAAGQLPAHGSLCSVRRGGKAGGGVHLLWHFPDLGGRDLAPPASEHLCGLRRKCSASRYWEANQGLGKTGLVSSPRISCVTTCKSSLSFWPTAVAVNPGPEPAESPVLGGQVSVRVSLFLLCAGQPG